jgi:hypothetical protein
MGHNSVTQKNGVRAELGRAATHHAKKLDGDFRLPKLNRGGRGVFSALDRP